MSAKKVRRADGEIKRAIYVEVDEETYELLMRHKHQTNSTYSRIIQTALREYLSDTTIERLSRETDHSF